MNEQLILSPADMEAVIQRLDRIERAIAKSSPANSAVEPLVVSREQAAEKLGASVSSIDAWRRDGLLPATYIDRKPRFAVADLEQFVESGKKGGIDGQ